jgi:ABC-2 type transport system ATP-binding protein
VEYAIETHALSKTYKGGIHALRGVNLKVPRGCCFGLLGPNGAGKSTLVKVLLSIVRASGGSATLMGRDIRSAAARRKVGYLPEGHRFPRYLTASGVCRYFGGLAGLRGEELDRDVAAKLELVGMSDWGDTKVSKFSKGMAQRVGVAQSMLGDPDLVFLDEPTDGVDPVARQGLRAVIKDVTARGATVFINSHLLADLEVLCDDVAILNRGEMLSQGSVSEITAAVAGVEGIRVRFRTGELPEPVWASLDERGAAREPDDYFSLQLSGEGAISGLVDELRAAKVDIYAVEPVKVRLEEAFVELITASGGAGKVERR